MQIVQIIFLFIFGSIIGSFLNVVIFRYGTGRGLGGRSFCAHTGETLKWYELVPIFSYIFQGGRSRHTGSRISPQYLLVELATGLLFAVAGYLTLGSSISFNYDVLNLLFQFLVISLLICIFVYDLRHKIIPNEWSYTLAGLAFLSLFIGVPGVLTLPTGLEIASGFLTAAPFALLWFISKGKWMGFGDAKLTLSFGWLVGLSGGFAAVILAFWIGAVIGVILLLVKKKKGRSEIPFGPFLILGLFLVYLGVTLESIIYLF